MVNNNTMDYLFTNKHCKKPHPSLGNLVNLVIFSCKLHEERSFIKMSKIISESLYGKSVDCAGDRLRFQRFLKNRKSDLQIVLQYFQCTNSQGN